MARVLVVDDQLCVRQLICDELVDEGYDVVTAPDARSVGLMLEKWDMDLVVLDLYLDGSEGWKLLRSVKKRYPKMPVIIFTAYDTFMDDARLKEADDYIVKSMDLDPLKKAISRSLIGLRPTGYRSRTAGGKVTSAYDYEPAV